MKLESYDICKGCGRSNIMGKMGLCFGCYVHRNDKREAELRHTIEFAKDWLKRHPKHKDFDTALKKYEGFVDELNLLVG